MAKNIVHFFIALFVVTPFTIVVKAKSTGGTVVVQGKVVLPSCTISFLNASPNYNQTINSETESTLSIPIVDYADLALSSALGTEFGMSVGQLRTMSNAQFDASLNRIYASAGNGYTYGYAKASLRVQCVDSSTITSISFKVQEASGNTSSTSLPFSGTTAAAANTSLEMNSFIRYENVSSNNTIWNNFQNNSARFLPTSGTSYVDVSSINILTKKSAAITSIGTANLNFTATQQLSFTYN